MTRRRKSVGLACLFTVAVLCCGSVLAQVTQGSKTIPAGTLHASQLRIGDGRVRPTDQSV
jgi:hypothetical protein